MFRCVSMFYTCCCRCIARYVYTNVVIMHMRMYGLQYVGLHARIYICGSLTTSGDHGAHITYELNCCKSKLICLKGQLTKGGYYSGPFCTMRDRQHFFQRVSPESEPDYNIDNFCKESTWFRLMPCPSLNCQQLGPWPSKPQKRAPKNLKTHKKDEKLKK